MRKILPFIMVIAFWGIFCWVQSNPRIGDAIAAIGVVVITITIVLFTKKILRFVIENLK